MPDLLSCGPTYILLTNVAYALPAVKTTIYSGDAAPALEQSNISTFATKSTLTLTNGSASISGTFIRTTAGPTTITLKRD